MTTMDTEPRIPPRIKLLHTASDVRGLIKGQGFRVHSTTTGESFNAVTLNNNAQVLEFLRLMPQESRVARDAGIRKYTVPQDNYAFYQGDLIIPTKMPFTSVTPRDSGYEDLRKLCEEFR